MILTFIKNLIADRISKSWEEQTYEENKTLAIIGKLLNPENLKRLGIIAIVGVVIFTLIKRWSEIHTYRSAIAAEMKKQLEPVTEKLDELQEQNEELRRQNEQIQEQLAYK
jgi:Sec-independent protein translocase protein TatA